jgi:para-aminobenzoate synthetase component I
MPTQEVARAARPSALLQRGARRHRPVLLDGGGPDSWLHGDVLYADDPSATLEVFASGWARRRSGDAETWRWGDPLALWDEFLAEGRAALGADADGAGFLTVLSYELKHWIESLPRRHRWSAQPLLYCARYDWSYRANYRRGDAHVAAARRDELLDRLKWYDDANVPSPVATSGHGGGPGRGPSPEPSAGTRQPERTCPRPALSRAQYAAMLDRAHEYIAAGDVYEVNLAQRFIAPASLDDAPALFAAWSERFPMPFAAYVDGGTWIAVSNSPECLLHTDGSSVATFPIKGTRRRERGAAADVLGAALRSDPKERAEHVMVVDLERNDLGRICEIGSVHVAEFAAVRQYPVLVHMVSEVRGRLRPGTPLAALLRAVFPGGSITGAPKIRATEIIEELEPAARGLYTGAIGWTDVHGDSRFSIAIRTAVVDAAGLTYWAGGGIVADSDPEREYQETLLKSETLFRALGSLQRRSA